jgi:putative DNA primase/helicase
MTTETSDLKEALKKATTVLNHCLKSEAAPRINAMLDLARSEPDIPILPEQLDRHPWLLNCPNGTLELQTGTLREHRREDYITKLCPTPYDPNATAPQWEAFLSRIFDKKSGLIAYVQRMLGCCLTGDVSEQLVWIFWGVGANGKSTLLNTFIEMLSNDYAIKAAPELVMVKRGETHPTERADLFGRRLAVCVETDEGRKLAEALVKDLTGGDRQRARRMKEDFWEFTPTHKIILCTNHKPAIAGTDHAMWRRVRLIPFTVIIPEAEQDKRLPEKLQAELPGVLAWCVRGCLDWQRDGLGLPEEVKAATAEYRLDQDLVGRFIADMCDLHPELRCRAGQLYTAFVGWGDCVGEKQAVAAKSQRAFGEALRAKGFERYTSNGTWYRGLQLRQSNVELADD